MQKDSALQMLYLLVLHIFINKINKSLKAGEMDIKDLDLNRCTNCWVCEGWSPMTFRFRRDKSNLPHSKIGPDDDVLIHLNIDGFAPDQMEKDPDNEGEYVITRMVPPKPIEYYFSVDGIPRYRIDIESTAASTSKNPMLKALQMKGMSLPWRF